jgi:hypothetical protein
MSYSYIKSVFPNFETNKELSNIYNTLGGVNLTLTTDDKNKSVPVAYDDTEMKGFAHNLLKNEITLPPNKLLEKYQNVPVIESTATFPLAKTGTNNLHYYNLPLPQPKLEQKEGFENNEAKIWNLECETYVKHILECSKCRAMITKQLNVETDRIRNEEIMELVSYLIFGIFILLLLENFKRN